MPRKKTKRLGSAPQRRQGLDKMPTMTMPRDDVSARCAARGGICDCQLHNGMYDCRQSSLRYLPENVL